MVTIHYADYLLLSEILQFIELIDCLGYQSASISSRLCNSYWFNPLSGQSLPTISLSHLRILDIDHQYLFAWQWSSLLLHLIGPGLKALFIKGQPTIYTLCKFLSQHHHICRLHFTPHWAKHTHYMKLSGCPKEILQLPLLSEMEGPPCHLQALLRCLKCVPDALAIKVGLDSRMAYSQYIYGVLGSVSLCGPHVHLEIHLSACYALDYNLELNQSEIKTLSIITLLEVVSLDISFPSMSARCLLVCFQ